MSTAQTKPLPHYFHLLQYPFPPPADDTVLAIICTSIAQALACLTALLSHNPPSDRTLNQAISTLEHDRSVLGWQRYFSDEQRDSLLSQTHRCIATSFSSSNTPPSPLFQLRSFALRCLLLKKELESDAFWIQTTRYFAAYGKATSKHPVLSPNNRINYLTEDDKLLIQDCVRCFNSMIDLAQKRSDSNKFTSGSAFHTFCETTLVLMQRVGFCFCLLLH